jgi:hypothetical protein
MVVSIIICVGHMCHKSYTNYCNHCTENPKLVYIYLITQSNPLCFMAVKYGALLTQIQLDLDMELYLRTEFTQISFVKNYILNFVNLF